MKTYPYHISVDSGAQLLFKEATGAGTKPALTEADGSETQMLLSHADSEPGSLHMQADGSKTQAADSASMNLQFSLSAEAVPFLDLLYNHKHICELLIQKEVQMAIAQFHAQSSFLDQITDRNLPALRCIYLNSLNRCLYNYILFFWDLSLSECCFQNKLQTHLSDTREEFLKSGEAIIHNYSASLSFYPTQANHVAKACAYIKEHLNEDLSLASVAKDIYVSSCYLCKIFKPLTGQSFSCYVQNQRLAQARNLLLTTHASVDQIASDCGFRSASYFSTAFRKANGITPVRFRNNYTGQWTREQ